MAYGAPCGGSGRYARPAVSQVTSYMQHIVLAGVIDGGCGDGAWWTRRSKYLRAKGHVVCPRTVRSL
eukprot:2983277-Prymnesium_polylepis.1